MWSGVRIVEFGRNRALYDSLPAGQSDRIPRLLYGSLALQLGYKDKKVLTRDFAGSCAELLARRRAVVKVQIAQVRRELQSYTRLEPAPSMAEVCRKPGLKPLTASRKFPAEYKLIGTSAAGRWPDSSGCIKDCGLHSAAPPELLCSPSPLPVDES